RQRGIEVIFSLLHHKKRQERGCRVPCFHLVCGVDSWPVITGNEARLELSNPVETFEDGAGGLTRRALLEGAVREVAIVEGAERRGPSAQHPDKCERGGNSVEKEPKSPYELKSLLGLTLDLVEWMVASKEKRNKGTAPHYCKCRITVLFRHLEG